MKKGITNRYTPSRFHQTHFKAYQYSLRKNSLHTRSNPKQPNQPAQSPTKTKKNKKTTTHADRKDTPYVYRCRSLNGF